MKKILITSDFLMTSSEEQDNNIKWLSDFLTRPISLSTDVNIGCFSTGKHNFNGFSQSKFFENSNISYDSSAKQFYFDNDQISELSLNYLSGFFNKNTLIIGYELSVQTRFILEQLGVTYIDIWLHPIRYLDDVLFGLFSNNKDIHSRIHKFNINAETYYLYADRLKVQNYRGHRRSNVKIKHNSALFVGQTLMDKAIFHNNKMLTLLDFKHEFELAVKEYDHVYYSRHPFVKEGDEEILSYLKRFKNVSLNNDPAYHLLASPEIEYVFSISSSVVHEAKYFGKKTKFLHRPVISIGDDSNLYQSVMHEIFYGNFWSQILSPVIPTNELKSVSYFSGKDKTRDALSFYWGYRNIDKVESLKQTVSTLWNKNNSRVEKGGSKVVSGKIKTIYEMIDESKVISFDIFDTLVTRKTFSPREIFNLVEDKYNENALSRIKDFKQFRIISENKAVEKALQLGRQDCTLDEIYHEFSMLLKFDPLEVRKLMELEIEIENENIFRRDRGMDVFEYAKRSGKKIILTSDMYLSSDVIIGMLNKNNITGFSDLYVSSEIGLKKKTGDLFNYILKANDIRPEDIVHIGDNIDGDVKVPDSLGIRSYRIPRSLDIAKFKHAHLKEWIDEVSVNKTPLLDATVTSIINRFYDDELSVNSSLYDGSRYKFGYCAFGPMIIGFTSWIWNELKRKNIQKVFFLSRDTKVVFDCFKVLYPDTEIDARYLFSSRRSVKIPLYESTADIIAEVYKTIYSTTVSKWLESRFGLTKNMYNEDILINLGLSGYEQAIGGKFSKDKLVEIVTNLSDRILENAAEEKRNLTSYLISEGMNSESDIAIVDIGYAGTMQAAYRRLLGKENIHGLYYATFNTVLKNINDLSLVNGYSFNLGMPSSTKNGICTHRFFYESIFCDADYSFVKPIRIGSEFKFIKTDFEDSVRQSVVKDIHAGVIDLAKTLKETYDNSVLTTPIDPELGSKLFDNFLKNPEKADACIFKGILFEDSMVPNSRRYLYIPDHLNTDKVAIANMIWKEASSKFFKLNEGRGNISIQNPPKPNLGKNKVSLRKVNNSKLLKFESKLIKISMNERKVKKYTKDRELFFTDSKNQFILAYYNIIGKKL